jgi:hypothetical protein
VYSLCGMVAHKLHSHDQTLTTSNASGIYCISLRQLFSSRPAKRLRLIRFPGAELIYPGKNSNTGESS